MRLLAVFFFCVVLVFFFGFGVVVGPVVAPVLAVVLRLVHRSIALRYLPVEIIVTLQLGSAAALLQFDLTDLLRTVVCDGTHRTIAPRFRYHPAASGVG